MTQQAKVLVFGRVQGVYFRYFTQKKAKALGVVGTVRNLPDGCVEIIAQADSAVLQAMLDWCHKGPITARVDRVEVTELTSDVSLLTFEII
ncbi:acylphosphatase [Crenothrix polyspora]|jgi:acylphosphatase|uniref:acylphosphatase n=1 Tax=Crenothrix polyspora TaxID=360316 RepID=A0A1R4H6L5_9GAMM|nr:acylphosphatase [Crenothrix polyspora]SJM91500.1 Acylphosphatase [Crenothrix polyspora]